MIALLAAFLSFPIFLHHIRQYTCCLFCFIFVFFLSSSLFLFSSFPLFSWSGLFRCVLVPRTLAFHVTCFSLMNCDCFGFHLLFFTVCDHISCISLRSRAYQFFDIMVDSHCVRDKGGFALQWLVAFHWVRAEVWLFYNFKSMSTMLSKSSGFDVTITRTTTAECIVFRYSVSAASHEVVAKLKMFGKRKWGNEWHRVTREILHDRYCFMEGCSIYIETTSTL